MITQAYPCNRLDFSLGLQRDIDIFDESDRVSATLAHGPLILTR